MVRDDDKMKVGMKGATIMGKKLSGGWALRALLLLALAVAIPACDNDATGGSGGSGGYWIDTSTGITPGVGAGDTPLNWIDSGSVPPGPGGIVYPSTDTRTYYVPDNYVDDNTDPRRTHSLMTVCSADDIVYSEQSVMGSINNYRIQGAGGGGGGIGDPLGGGGGVTPLAYSTSLRQNARAHCKHFAVQHDGAPFVEENPEGDGLLGGAGSPGIKTPRGRIPKCEFAAPGGVQDQIAGTDYIPATAANYFIGNNAVEIQLTTYTTMGVGHWRTGNLGSQNFFWTFIISWTAPLN